jgi:pimeloyl-ACP methyl ester carboxylesterase
VLHHVRQGAGEPLVLIHGIGSQWQAWTAVLGLLASQRDVVALDLPGFGDSAPLAGEVTLGTLAAAVAELVGELGIDRPHVGGNSLGGAIGFELARQGVARSVTALSPLGFARGREVTFARRSLVGSRALARALAPGHDRLGRPRPPADPASSTPCAPGDAGRAPRVARGLRACPLLG